MPLPSIDVRRLIKANEEFTHAKNYIPNRVITRGGAKFVCDVSDWEENYRRRNHQQQCGFGSSKKEPYVCLGDVHLDSESLILSCLEHFSAAKSTYRTATVITGASNAESAIDGNDDVGISSTSSNANTAGHDYQQRAHFEEYRNDDSNKEANDHNRSNERARLKQVRDSEKRSRLLQIRRSENGYLFIRRRVVEAENRVRAVKTGMMFLNTLPKAPSQDVASPEKELDGRSLRTRRKRRQRAQPRPLSTASGLTICNKLINDEEEDEMNHHGQQQEQTVPGMRFLTPRPALVGGDNGGGGGGGSGGGSGAVGVLHRYASIVDTSTHSHNKKGVIGSIVGGGMQGNKRLNMTWDDLTEDKRNNNQKQEQFMPLLPGLEATIPVAGGGTVQTGGRHRPRNTDAQSSHQLKSTWSVIGSEKRIKVLEQSRSTFSVNQRDLNLNLIGQLQQLDAMRLDEFHRKFCSLNVTDESSVFDQQLQMDIKAMREAMLESKTAEGSSVYYFRRNWFKDLLSHLKQENDDGSRSLQFLISKLRLVAEGGGQLTKELFHRIISAIPPSKRSSLDLFSAISFLMEEVLHTNATDYNIWLQAKFEIPASGLIRMYQTRKAELAVQKQLLQHEHKLVRQDYQNHQQTTASSHGIIQKRISMDAIAVSSPPDHQHETLAIDDAKRVVPIGETTAA